MSLAHQSVATINSPQFINLQPLDINPLMSSCEIKVLYLGENRNNSYISKQVATQMAKTLRGAPIVGYYKDSKEDFADHGDQMIFDDEGFHFNCLTKPYGFVAPDAKVWFQDFQDADDFGNTIVRTYLMTTGYLWTGQFEQAKAVVEQGRPQSMELDEKSLQGKWSTNIKDNIEFFIINDAIFSKLCILGDDVQPCFQGAAITAPEVSTSFTLDDNFKQTLFKMMKDLQYALEGGSTVADIENVVPTEEVNDSIEIEEVTSDFTIEETTKVENNQDNNNQSSFQENEFSSNEEVSENFVKDETEDKKDDNDDEEDKDDTKEDPQEEEKKKYTALETEYNELKANYAALEEEVSSLRSFKADIENKQKDELISEFYMLSDQDKKDVIENKANYSLSEIKSKLAVICFEKKVNFNLETSNENQNTIEEENSNSSVVTFNVDTNRQDSTPDWVKEVELTMNNNKF